MNTRSTHQCSACAVRNIWEHHRPAVGSNFWPLSERDRSLWEARFVAYHDLLFLLTPKLLAKFQNILKKDDQDRNKSDPASRKMSLKFHQVWTEWKKSEQTSYMCTRLGTIGRKRSRSLSESTRQITPPTKNGHAPPFGESRKSFQSVNPSSVLTRQGFPCWVKLSNILHAWWCHSVNSFKFQPCDGTSPWTHELVDFSLRGKRDGRCRSDFIQNTPPAPSWHRLQCGLWRYLIIFDPHTLVLDRRKPSGQPLSPQFVPGRSKNFTSLDPIRLTQMDPIVSVRIAKAFRLRFRIFRKKPRMIPQKCLRISANSEIKGKTNKRKFVSFALFDLKSAVDPLSFHAGNIQPVSYGQLALSTLNCSRWRYTDAPILCVPPGPTATSCL